MKNKKFWIGLGAVLLAALTVGGILLSRNVIPTVNHGLRIGSLLQPVLEARQQRMHVHIRGSAGEKEIALETDVYLLTEEENTWLVLEREQLRLYVTGELLLLENGKAFHLGQSVRQQTMSWQELLPGIVALYDGMEITATENGLENTYTVTVAAEQVSEMLACLSLEDTFSGIRQLDLSITERDGSLEQIRFSGDCEAEGAAVRLEVTLSDFRILEDEEYSVPAGVREAAATVDPGELFSLTEDLFRLLPALAPFADMENVTGSLILSVDCGVLQLDTELALSQLQGASAGLDPETLRALPEMLGWLCMEGDIRCLSTASGYRYILALDGTSIGQLARMILPELEKYSECLTGGTVEILLEGDRIRAMKISIEGAVTALVLKVPVTITAEFLFD